MATAYSDASVGERKHCTRDNDVKSSGAAVALVRIKRSGTGFNPAAKAAGQTGRVSPPCACSLPERSKPTPKAMVETLKRVAITPSARLRLQFASVEEGVVRLRIITKPLLVSVPASSA